MKLPTTSFYKNPFINFHELNIRYVVSENKADYYLWIYGYNDVVNNVGQILKVINNSGTYYSFSLTEKYNGYLSVVQEKCKRLLLLI